LRLSWCTPLLKSDNFENSAGSYKYIF